jgi:hypothetical protein
MKKSLNVYCDDCNNYAQRGRGQIIKEKISIVPESCSDFRRDISKFGLKNCFGQFVNISDWKELGSKCISKYENVECSNPEHAIILINPENSLKKLYVYSSGIDLLIDYFEKNKNAFRLYNCHTCEDFYKSFKIWVIGHGDRHGVSFGKGKGKYCPFCKLEKKYSNDKTPQLFIAQLHCCNHKGRTLYEYLSVKPGIFSEGSRSVIQNREEIAKWIEKNYKNEVLENIKN